MFFKDLRIWSFQKSYDQTTRQRNFQINPFNYLTTELIAYYRMAESSFIEFNYENIVNQ